jgi:hypothetical protein
MERGRPQEQADPVKRSVRLLKASSPWIVLALVLLVPVSLFAATLFAASPHSEHARRNADVRAHVAAMHKSVDVVHATMQEQVRRGRRCLSLSLTPLSHH